MSATETPQAPTQLVLVDTVGQQCLQLPVQLAGGETALSNLVLLCAHHHGTVEPLRFQDRGAPATRWTVRIDDDGHPEFTPPARGGPLVRAPARARAG